MSLGLNVRSSHPPKRFRPLKTLHFALLLSISTLTATSLGQQAAQFDTPMTLHARVNLVVVDVVVTDSNHHPVSGLTRDQFSLTDGKIPQVIKGFEEHTAPSDAELAKFAAFPKLPPGVFTNYVAAPANGSAINVLLLDALNTPLSDQQYVRQQLLDYIQHEKPGTSVAIFGLSSQLVMLQGFTSDPNLLKRAIEAEHGKGSILLDNVVGGEGIEDSLSDTVAADQPPAPPGSRISNTGPSLSDAVANLKTFEDLTTSFQASLRARYTLDAMNELARYLANLPGRKNLIWFSGSFPINLLPSSDGAGDPFAAVINMEEEYRETVNMLAKSQVAVYPVDARGLQTAPMYSATQKGTRYSANPSTFNEDLHNFQQARDSEHQTMSVMAQDTGGQAFFNTNGLSEAVSKVIDNGSNYYTLAYNPTDEKLDGEFRRINIKLAASGYTLSYRQGYYADDPQSPKTALARTAATAGTPTEADAAKAIAAAGEALIQKAMQHGVPGSTQILYTVRVLPAAAPSVTEDTLAKDNAANRTGFLPIKPPYRTYRIDFGTDPSNIVFTRGADNLYHGSIEFVSYVYQSDGQILNSISNQIRLGLPPARYLGMMKNGGITFTQEISTPTQGDFTIRTGIRDLTSNHIGSAELPLSLVKNLAPLPVQPQPSANNPATPLPAR